MDQFPEREIGPEGLEHYIHLGPLIRGVFRNYKMSRIMKLLEKSLGHPAVVVDMSFKIIDETPSITGDYRSYVRNDVFLERSCADLIKANYLLKNKASPASSCVLISHPVFHNFLVTTIKAANAETDIMILAVFENGVPFEPSDYERIRRVRQILTVQYQKTDITFSRDRMALPNRIVYSLLNGEPVTKEELTQSCHVPWAIHKKLYFMIIDDEDSQTDPRLRFLSILPALRTFLPAEYCLTYRSLIISFLGPAQFDDLYFKRRNEFEQFLKANHLCCGISQEYSDILDSRTYYFSVQHLLSLAKRRYLTLAYFPDMYFHILHDQISSEYSLDIFIHPIIKLLQDYDTKHSSNLLETLEIYLSNRSDPDVAAKQLFIHRSTLFYRVKKIRELTGYCLEDIDELSKIYVSLQLYKIDQKYKEIKQ